MTEILIKYSIVVLKFLFPFIACANVKERVSDYPSGIKAWKRLLKVASDKPETSWELDMEKHVPRSEDEQQGELWIRKELAHTIFINKSSFIRITKHQIALSCK